MDSIIAATPVSVFSLFAWGFVAGSFFSFILLMTIDFISSRKQKMIDQTQVAKGISHGTYN